MKIIPWVLLALVTTILIAFLSNQGLSGEELRGLIESPFLIAIILSLFGYLIIGRLKDMEDRISKNDDRILGFWKDTEQKIQKVAVTESRNVTGEIIGSVENKLAGFTDRIDDIISKNSWLNEIDPEELMVSTKRLEPVHVKAAELIKSDPSKKDFVRKWITNLIGDPETLGTPNDFHNLGVLAARDLDDDLLAMMIYERYLNENDDPSADVLADILQITTRAELWEKGDSISERIKEKIFEEDFRFTNKWRPWVFLSEYYIAKGQLNEATVLLERAKESIKDPKQKEHAIRNLALLYERLDLPEKAEEIYKDMKNNYYTHVPAGNQYVAFLLKQGRKEEAFMVCDEYISRGNLNPEFTAIYERLQAIKASMKSSDSDPASHFNNGIKFVLKIASDELDESAFQRLVKSLQSASDSHK